MALCSRATASQAADRFRSRSGQFVAVAAAVSSGARLLAAAVRANALPSHLLYGG